MSLEIIEYSSIRTLMEPRLPPSVRHQLIDSQAENLRIQSALTFEGDIVKLRIMRNEFEDKKRFAQDFPRSELSQTKTFYY